VRKVSRLSARNFGRCRRRRRRTVHFGRKTVNFSENSLLAISVRIQRLGEPPAAFCAKLFQKAAQKGVFTRRRVRRPSGATSAEKRETLGKILFWRFRVGFPLLCANFFKRLLRRGFLIAARHFGRKTENFKENSL